MRPGFDLLVVIYRAHILSGELRVPAAGATGGRSPPRPPPPPIPDLAWPSHIHGLDAWRAYEPTP